MPWTCAAITLPTRPGVYSVPSRESGQYDPSDPRFHIFNLCSKMGPLPSAVEESGKDNQVATAPFLLLADMEAHGPGTRWLGSVGRLCRPSEHPSGL